MKLPFRKVVCVFGTRPETIKFAPVISELEVARNIHLTNIISSQHRELLRQMIDLFAINVHDDLDVMRADQSPNDVLSRVSGALDARFAQIAPDLVLVQGDTTTALAAALAAFNRRIPVGHIEAGLRTGNPTSPFPEEMNRRLITRMARLHFAATTENRDSLVAEGVVPGWVHVTGNPVVDALQKIRTRITPSPDLARVLEATQTRRRIVLTAHRRENHGDLIEAYFRVLRDFVTSQPDMALIFPVHPNPAVRAAAQDVFGDIPNFHRIEPLDYADFIGLVSAAWLVVSDSGGIQEETPSLGKPLLVLRKETERREAINAGVARLVPGPEQLAHELRDAARPDSWTARVGSVANPFGDGHAGARIATEVTRFLNQNTARPAAQGRADSTTDQQGISA